MITLVDYWWENHRSGSLSKLESSHTDHVEIIRDNCDIGFHLLSNIRNYLFYAQEFAKKCPVETNLWHPATGKNLKKRDNQNVILGRGRDCFGTPSGIASDIYFLDDCFKAALGSVLNWKGKQAGAAVGRVNQGHLGLTLRTSPPPHPPPPSSASVAYLAWKRRSCAVSVQCHPVFAQNTLGGCSECAHFWNRWTRLDYRGGKNGLMIERDL